jgi:hypothetical protein
MSRITCPDTGIGGRFQVFPDLPLQAASDLRIHAKKIKVYTNFPDGGWTGE